VRRFVPPATPLPLLAALLPLLLFFAMASFDHWLEMARSRDHVAATTDALAEHAQKVVETADLALDRVLDRVEPLDWRTISSSRDVHDFLMSLKRQLPQLESVFLVAPDGANAASSRIFPMPPYSDTTRDYFANARLGNSALFFSEPFRSPIAGTYAFTITRPRLKDGHFDGLAGITISAAYFESFYRSLSVQSDQSVVALVRDDGTLLVRWPTLPQHPTRLSQSSQLFHAALVGGTSGVSAGTSSLDGHARLAGYKKLSNAPLLVSYAVDDNVYLRDWYYHLAYFAVLALIASVTIMLAGRAMLRDAADKQAALQRLVEETRRRQEAEAALQQAQKMEALGRLTGGLAHDFNNLLTAILGSLDLLQRHVGEARAVRLLATARKSATRGAQLTAHMLAFARRQEVALRPVDIAAAIRSMDDMLRGAVGPMVAIRYDLAEQIWPALADPVQFEVALLNLAVNARDAMPRGGELTITVAPAALTEGNSAALGLVPGEYVHVCVADTGMGMSESVRARALEPFFTTKGPSKGTGLGLSMVFGFATLVGGTMTLASTVGQGTKVGLYLPRANADSGEMPEAASEVQAPVARRSGGGSTMRILLIDDDEAVRSTTRLMLEELGHDVVEADSGRAALVVLSSDRRFDLLIIDFAMPEMNGGELATSVRRLWPEAPLLFVTGYVENDALRAWTEVGVPTLDKPFSQSALAATVARATHSPQPSARVIPFRS
jgi:signal transduction histidine kinase/ActR/RegA family two-component response regulator